MKKLSKDKPDRTTKILNRKNNGGNGKVVKTAPVKPVISDEVKRQATILIEAIDGLSSIKTVIKGTYNSKECNILLYPSGHLGLWVRGKQDEPLSRIEGVETKVDVVERIFRRSYNSIVN